MTDAISFLASRGLTRLDPHGVLGLPPEARAAVARFFKLRPSALETAEWCERVVEMARIDGGLGLWLADDELGLAVLHVRATRLGSLTLVTDKVVFRSARTTRERKV